MRDYLLTKIVLGSLSATTVLGGSYTNSFIIPNLTGLTLHGSALMRNGALVMTPKTGGGATVVLTDLDAGTAIESFTARFQLKFGPGTTDDQADGLFFGFGPGINANASFGVEGPSGNAAVGIEFDTYDNASPDNIGIDVKVAGVEIATTLLGVNDFVDSQFHDVFIQLNTNGTLNLTWNGRIIYTNLFLPNWVPVNGQFAFGASTGYFNEECDIRYLGINTIRAGAVIAPTITVQPPASVSLVEGSPLTLSVGFDGTAPFAFQWNLNGTAIQDATDTVLNIAHVPLADNSGQITCTVSSPTTSASVTSQPTTLTVTPDTTPLTIQSVAGSDTMGTVTVTFSKPILETTATTAINYSIAGLTISDAELFTKLLTPWSTVTVTNERQVVLTTTQQTPGTAYTLVVNNVQDQTAAAHTIAANSQMTFHAFNYVSGYMSYDIYDDQGFSAGNVGGFEAAYATLVPTRTLLFGSADTPDWEYGGNYGSLSQGLIVAPQTGTYIFHIASDDQSQLFLSTDNTPANLSAQPICQVTTFTAHLQWAGNGQGMPNTNAQTGNVSNPINLVQGQKYFFRCFHVEGTGGDGISIGWEQPSSPGIISVVPGPNLMALLNPDVSPVPTLSISRSLTGIAITFTGVLQASDVLTGPWIDLVDSSPLVISPDAAMKFFRARGGQ
jgi:hypothetical protein